MDVSLSPRECEDNARRKSKRYSTNQHRPNTQTQGLMTRPSFKAFARASEHLSLTLIAHSRLSCGHARSASEHTLAHTSQCWLRRDRAVALMHSLTDSKRCSFQSAVLA